MTRSAQNKRGLLAIGREPVWRRSRPRLAADSSETGLDVAPGGLDEDSPPAAKTIGRLLGLVASLAVFLLIGTWIVLGLTVLPVMKMGSELWVVKWAAFPEGQVPAGSTVAASDEPIQRDLGSRFTGLFGLNPDSRAIYGVIAGPGGTVSANPGEEILWNDQSTNVISEPGIVPISLGDNYLAVCLAGQCEEIGGAVTLPASHVLGEPLGQYLPLASLGDVPDLPSMVK